MSTEGGVQIRSAALALICCGAILTMAGGCGSDSGSAQADRPATWAEEAGRLCSAALFQREHLPEIHFTTYHDVVPTMVRNERVLARKLAGLKGRERDEASVSRLTALLVRQAQETEKVMANYGARSGSKLSRVPQYEVHLRRVRDLDRTIGAIARSLGAGACARTPVRVANL